MMLEKLNQKCNKKLKGMTLIEVMIALAVFIIAGTLMVKIGSVSHKQLMNANHLNNKTQAESVVGRVNDKTTLDEYCDANTVTKSNGETAVTFSVGTYGNVTAKRYATNAADEASGKDCNTGLDANQSLHFYIMD